MEEMYTLAQGWHQQPDSWYALPSFQESETQPWNPRTVLFLLPWEHLHQKLLFHNLRKINPHYWNNLPVPRILMQILNCVANRFHIHMVISIEKTPIRFLIRPNEQGLNIQNHRVPFEANLALSPVTLNLWIDLGPMSPKGHWHNDSDPIISLFVLPLSKEKRKTAGISSLSSCLVDRFLSFSGLSVSHQLSLLWSSMALSFISCCLLSMLHDPFNSLQNKERRTCSWDYSRKIIWLSSQCIITHFQSVFRFVDLLLASWYC